MSKKDEAMRGGEGRKCYPSTPSTEKTSTVPLIRADIVPAAQSWLTLRRREAALGMLLVLPVVLFVIVFVLGPTVSTVWLSFFSRNLLRPEKGTQFVGLGNYRLMWKYNVVQPTFRNSVLIATGTVVFQLLIGLGIALLLNRSFRGRGIVRASFILPWALPTIVAAFVMRWMFDTNYGAVNQILLGLKVVDKGPVWLGRPTLALITVIIAHVWKGLPYMILVLLAGLQLIPQNIRDAARVDGVSAWQEFWYITLPHLRYLIAITVVLRFIWTFNWFDFVFLLTGGGPGKATRTLPIQVYITAFRTFKMGQAASFATVMAVTLIVFTVVFFHLALAEEETA